MAWSLLLFGKSKDLLMQLVEEINHRERLIDQFLEVRHKTELLCGPLTLEDMVVSATQDTSPPKWHLAHTTWFFEHFLLLPFLPHYHGLNTQFSQIFNSYYLGINNPLEKNKRSVLSRPSTEEVIQYRRYVEREVQKLLETSEEWDAISQIIKLGMNHEQQHQELLLMDIKQNFFNNPLHPSYESRQYLETFTEYQEAQWVKVEGGLVEIGVSHRDESFAYDNERDRHKVWIDDFLLSSHLITNGDYLNFIHDQGYQRHEFWSSDGFRWVKENDIKTPLYWIERDREYWEFSLYGDNPLNLESPVSHISYYEAEAFAKYMNARLPTEAEWELAADAEPIEGQFLEDEFYLPDVAQHDYLNFSQMHGCLWEWTASPYTAYPRYHAYRGSIGEYNSKFMNQQYVLRGGSCITPRNHYRKTYRNYYYPHMRWHFSGIRLAKDNL